MAAPRPKPGTLQFAFLGCGRVTRLHSATLARLNADVRMHYASRDAAKAALFRDRHRGGKAFASYQEAVNDPMVDVIVVATPPALHLEQALAALEAGKDVIVEKPAFLATADFQRVREAEAGSDGRVFVAENYFYKPMRRRLHDILRDGIIGEPLLLDVTAVKRQQAVGWRADRALAGGGGLFEGGIHWINFMASLGLDVRSVSGHLVGPDEPGARALEESALVVFRYEGGAVGKLAFSWDVPSATHGLGISKIYGREGSVTFESNGIFAFVRGRRTRLHLPGFWDIAGYRAMFTDFIGALHQGRAPEMTLDMAERDVRLVRTVYDASAERPSDAREDA